MRKVLSLVLCAVMLLGCIPAMAEEAAPVKTGVSFVTNMAGSETGSIKVNVYMTAVTVDDNGVIDACVIDNLTAGITFDATGKLTSDVTAPVLSKNDLGDAYGMRVASSINAEWNEQAAAFANYCVGKTIDELKGMALTEDGKPADADLAAGCTLATYNFLPYVEEAVNNATHRGAKKGDTLKLVHSSSTAGSKDATAEAEGQTQLVTNVAAVTFDGDVITSCFIDCVDATVKFNAAGQITGGPRDTVTSKYALKEGYNMKTYGGATYEWFEQADNFSAYVVGKTVADVTGIAVTEGKPADADLAATVTIAIGDFQKLIELAGK